jgi:hypothetical protein
MGEFRVGNDRALRLLQKARRNGHQLVLPEPGPTA